MEEVDNSKSEFVVSDYFPWTFCFRFLWESILQFFHLFHFFLFCGILVRCSWKGKNGKDHIMSDRYNMKLSSWKLYWWFNSKFWKHPVLILKKKLKKKDLNKFTYSWQTNNEVKIKSWWYNSKFWKHPILII